ncbi:MAG: nitroreductase family protein [Clostridia bacterium]|nr:nitroreductase family protein [Clostridia bacterium]
MKQSFTQLVNTRQSCRDFNDQPLLPETVKEIAEQAMLSPSACNSQPWKMYLITSEKMIEEVKKCVQGHGHNKFTQKAKAFICVSERASALREDVEEKFSRNFFVKYDVGELVAYITLTAESMGVKSCIIGWVASKDLAKALNLDSDERCNLVIALGYSDTPIRKKTRKKAQDVIIEL